MLVSLVVNLEDTLFLRGTWEFVSTAKQVLNKKDESWSSRRSARQVTVGRNDSVLFLRC